MKKRAFLVYECRHGWCIKPVEVQASYGEYQNYVWAFSRLSQALWWLQRRIRLEDQPSEPPEPTP